MNRAFYRLPDPREVGLKWREFEKAREKVDRIDQRQREAAEAEVNRVRYVRAEVRGLMQTHPHPKYIETL